jgi:hypothetical protein
MIATGSASNSVLTTVMPWQRQEQWRGNLFSLAPSHAQQQRSAMSNQSVQQALQCWWEANLFDVNLDSFIHFTLTRR